MAFGNVPAVAAVLYGIKPAVTAIVVFAAWRIGSRALRSAPLWIVAAAAFISIFAFGLPFPAIIVAAAIIGYIGGRIAPDKFRTAGSHSSSGASHGRSLIDDDTPTPAHARFSRGRFALVLAIGLLIWGGALGALVALFGWDGTLAQMGWFFTKAALLTFGGAYAVLPYVYQGAVDHYGWLTATQMIDGLALGETTPGPLIMVVTFVGFVGGWSRALFGTDAAFAAGALAAVVVTFFTFLPSFLFILLGGPLIETTHKNLKITAPLTSITAAVVGVILNLAVFFALHVLWPEGFGGRLDWIAALIGAAALVALFRFKMGVIPVIAGCAAAGLVFKLLL
jgi:chromate transporter